MPLNMTLENLSSGAFDLSQPLGLAQYIVKDAISSLRTLCAVLIRRLYIHSLRPVLNPHLPPKLRPYHPPNLLPQFLCFALCQRP